MDRSDELHAWDPSTPSTSTATPIQEKNFNGLLDMMKQLSQGGGQTLLIMAHITRHPSEGSFFTALEKEFVYERYNADNCEMLAEDHADPRMTIYHIHATRLV
jgi:hypothetical protein